MVPVFTANRSISLASSFAPAASPRLRRRPSPWPPHRHAKPATESATHTGWPCAAPRPISTRFEPVPRLRSFNTGSSRIPSDLARRTQPVWQYQTVPALSALLPALPGVSRIRLRSAPARLLRQPGEEVSHLLRFPAPHGAPAPRGAFPRQQHAATSPATPSRPPHRPPATPARKAPRNPAPPKAPRTPAPRRPQAHAGTRKGCWHPPKSAPCSVSIPEPSPSGLTTGC